MTMSLAAFRPTHAPAFALGFAVSLVAAGCDATETGFDVGDDPECETTEYALGFDEPSPLGFSAEDVLGRTAGSYITHVRWSDGGSIGAELTLAYEGDEVRYREVAPIEPSEDLPPEPCPESSMILVPILLSFSTDDGAFDERWTTVSGLRRDDEVSFWADFELDELAGTYENGSLWGLTIEGSVVIESRSTRLAYGQISGVAKSEGPGQPSELVYLASFGE
jgi:hypothetical protein